MYTLDEIQILKAAKNILAKKAKSKYTVFDSPEATRQYLQITNELDQPQREVFRVLYMDSQHRLIKDESVFYGTIDAAPVYPRIVVQQALKYNAAAIILAHNHPSGVAEPSRADRAITERLVQALLTVDIKVLDHFVIGDDTIISFAERGWI